MGEREVDMKGVPMVTRKVTAHLVWRGVAQRLQSMKGNIYLCGGESLSAATTHGRNIYDPV